MKDSKQKSLNKNNKIIIHRLPLGERILYPFSTVALTLFYLATSYEKFKDNLETIIVFFGLVIACFAMYLLAFKNYICFYVDAQKITIRDGLSKEEFSTTSMTNVKITEDIKHKFFTLDICFTTYTKKNYDWLGPKSGVIFGSTRRQRVRLEKFCEECNAYLESRDKKTR